MDHSFNKKFDNSSPNVNSNKSSPNIHQTFMKFNVKFGDILTKLLIERPVWYFYTVLVIPINLTFSSRLERGPTWQGLSYCINCQVLISRHAIVLGKKCLQAFNTSNLQPTFSSWVPELIYTDMGLSISILFWKGNSLVSRKNILWNY